MVFALRDSPGTPSSVKKRCALPSAIFLSLVWFLCFSAPIPASYPPDPTWDIQWPYSTENSVSDIQNRFNLARSAENAQLGSSIPMLLLPSQAIWDAMSDGERAVYLWMYDDSSSAWGHRHILLWYPYNDNSGPAGKEGFIGIGRATGTFQSWPNSSIIVMNVFDPCSTWDYGSEIAVGDLDGNGSVGLEDALLGLQVLSRSDSGKAASLERESDKDGRIGLPDVLYILQAVAFLR